MTLPLTKTLQTTDYEQLTEELRIVDGVGTANQTHEARRWEYAMALRALDVWLETTRRGKGTAGQVIDVGGAGSPFHRMIGDSAVVVDPSAGTGTLAEYLQTAPRLSQAVFCLSVLEHVEDLDQFLYHLACLTAPGGLLFLTMDCRDDDHELAKRIGDYGWPDDTAHFHWMRKRIFTPRMILSGVLDPLTYLGFQLIGTQPDLQYHGHTLYGSYSIASLALVKRA